MVKIIERAILGGILHKKRVFASGVALGPWGSIFTVGAESKQLRQYLLTPRPQAITLVSDNSGGVHVSHSRLDHY